MQSIYSDSVVNIQYIAYWDASLNLLYLETCWNFLTELWMLEDMLHLLIHPFNVTYALLD